MDGASDGELLELARQGHPDAFSTLVADLLHSATKQAASGPCIFGVDQGGSADAHHARTRSQQGCLAPAELAQPLHKRGDPMSQGRSRTSAEEADGRGPPDGYTLFIVSSSNTINATLYDKLNFVCHAERHGRSG
jgi:hypothetical protein